MLQLSKFNTKGTIPCKRDLIIVLIENIISKGNYTFKDGERERNISKFHNE